jgi:hypothetical protein
MTSSQRSTRLRPFTIPHLRAYVGSCLTFRRSSSRICLPASRSCGRSSGRERQSDSDGWGGVVPCTLLPGAVDPDRASSAEQARILHTQAAGLVRRSGSMSTAGPVRSSRAASGFGCMRRICGRRTGRSHFRMRSATSCTVRGWVCTELGRGSCGSAAPSSSRSRRLASWPPSSTRTATVSATRRRGGGGRVAGRGITAAD